MSKDWTSNVNVKRANVEKFWYSVLWYHITPLCDYTLYILQGWGRGLPSPAPVLDHLFTFGLIITLSNKKTGRIFVKFFCCFLNRCISYPFSISFKFYILRAVCTESTDCWMDIVILYILPLSRIYDKTCGGSFLTFCLPTSTLSMFGIVDVQSFDVHSVNRNLVVMLLYSCVVKWLLAGFFYTK